MWARVQNQFWSLHEWTLRNGAQMNFFFYLTCVNILNYHIYFLLVKNLEINLGFGDKSGIFLRTFHNTSTFDDCEVWIAKSRRSLFCIMRLVEWSLTVIPGDRFFYPILTPMIDTSSCILFNLKIVNVNIPKMCVWEICI